MTTITEDFSALPDASLFSAILDSMGEAIWVIDFDKPHPYWFASSNNRLKYDIPADPIPATFWAENIHPDDAKRTIDGFTQAIKNTQLTEFKHEYWFKGAHNQYYFIHDTIKFLRDSDGKVKRVVGSWRDITQDRLREEKLEELFLRLEEERNRFKHIAELSNAAIWEIDHAVNSLTWSAGNRTLEEFGFNKPGYCIDDWINSIHPEDREQVANNFNHAISSGDSFFDTYRFLKTDGSFAYVIDQGTIFRNSEGKAVRSIGSWIDITRERKREIVLEQTIEQQRELNNTLRNRELELAKKEEELKQINDQLALNLMQLQEREFVLNQSQRLARIGSWEYDPNEKLMFWSEEMYSIYGVDRKLNISELNVIFDLFDEQSKTLVSDSFLRVMLQFHLPFDITAKLKTPLGYKKWIRLTGYPQVEGDRLTKVTGLTYDITYFKESEERIKASEEKFASAFRSNPDLMTIVREEDSLIADLNERVESVLGYTRSELIGTYARDLQLFIYPDEREAFYKTYQEDGRVEMECWWRRKDERPIIVRIAVTRLMIDNVYYQLAVIRDVSESRFAEERFRKAFDLNPDLMMIFRERDRVLVEVNGKLESFASFTREEAIGKSSSEFSLWADSRDHQTYLETLAHHDFVSIESTFYKKDNRTFIGVLSASRIKLHGENHLLVVVRDITEKKLAEERVVRSEAYLNAVINNTDFLIWSWDRRLKLTTFNEPFRKYIKATYNRDAAVGKSIFEDVAENEYNTLRVKWRDWHQRALGGESFQIKEVRGNRYWQFSISPIREGDFISGVTVFAEDVTTQREAEARIINNEAKLNAIINNTDQSIWSIDLNYRITALNKVFRDFVVDNFGFEFEVGQDILQVTSNVISTGLAEFWRELYHRAFAGESVLEENTMADRIFLISVHPIIENGRVLGASVYTSDITERKEKEAEAQQKTRALAEANKKIGELRLMALRSVMNPHFIFNALNSIQYFIAKNDRQNAISYLSTFSKLIRGVLTNSVNDKILLADELDLLQHYINLEMVRFENKFDFKLHIDPEIDMDQIEIPSLLIQPYVENAILHGLYNKEDKGLLVLSVQYDEDDRILFVVEDDGVGRIAARQLRQQHFPKHKSMGTELTEERLQLINQQKNVSFLIEDLISDNKPAGTRVKIWVKI